MRQIAIIEPIAKSDGVKGVARYNGVVMRQGSVLGPLAALSGWRYIDVQAAGRNQVEHDQQTDNQSPDRAPEHACATPC